MWDKKNRLPRLILETSCLFVIFVHASSCNFKPPPHVTFQVQDPHSLAPDVQRFAFHMGSFSEQCATSSACKIKTLNQCNLRDNTNVESCSVTLTSPTKGEQDVWIDALDAEDVVIARAYSRANFLYKDTSLSAILNKPCKNNETCLDDKDCNGVESCVLHSCKDGEPLELGDNCTTNEKAGTCDASGTCIEATCGDGHLCSAENCTSGPDGGVEKCDDGNTTTESCIYGQTECTVCDSNCQQVAGETSYCGDSATDSEHEECDDGNTINETCTAEECTFCNTQCKVSNDLPYCGDGTRDEGEACDDGNFSNNDVCLSASFNTPEDENDDCRFAECGDGFKNKCEDFENDPNCILEECDGDEQGNGGETAVCNTDCTESVCGDGILNITAGELCDDGNNENGDGCSADCTFLSWQTKLPAQNQIPQTVARTSALSGWNDMLFTISEQGHVFAIDDRSGDMRWTHATGDDSGFRHTLMRGNWSEKQTQSGEDQFYSVSDGGYIHCIDPYGRCSGDLSLACVHDSDCSSPETGTCVTTGYCIENKSVRCINTGDCSTVGGQCTVGNRGCCNTDRCGADCDVYWQSSYPHVGLQPNTCWGELPAPFGATPNASPSMAALASDACQAGQPCTNPSLVAMDGNGAAFEYNYCGSQALKQSYHPPPDDTEPANCVPGCYHSPCTWPAWLTYWQNANDELDFYCPNCVPTLGSRTLSDPWEFFLTPYNLINTAGTISSSASFFFYDFGQELNTRASCDKLAGPFNSFSEQLPVLGSRSSDTSPQAHLKSRTVGINPNGSLYQFRLSTHTDCMKQCSHNSNALCTWYDNETDTTVPSHCPDLEEGSFCDSSPAEYAPNMDWKHYLLNMPTANAPPALAWSEDPEKTTNGAFHIFFGDHGGYIQRFDSTPYRHCSATRGTETPVPCLENSDCGSGDGTCQGTVETGGYGFQYGTSSSFPPDQIWQSEALGGRIEHTPTLDAARNIYVLLRVVAESEETSDTGRLVKLKYEDGSILWSADLAAAPAGSALVADKMVYALTVAGDIYAFERGGETPDPDEGWWARQGANNSGNSQVISNAEN